MSALLVLAGLAVQVLLVLALVPLAAFVVWVLWDCLAGPSAVLAAEHRAREVRVR